jgi:tetratricopeptide (TPR) repeat protein
MHREGPHLMQIPALKAIPLPVNAPKLEVDIAIAHAFEAKGDLEHALTVANEVLNENPDHAVALLIAGRVCMKMNRYGMAYNLLKRSLSIHDRYDTRANLAAACIPLYLRDEAKRILQECRRIKPQDERALALLCLLAVYDCNPRLAIDLGEKALAMNPDLWDVHESVGYAHLMVGEFEKGFAGYERFIGKTKHRPVDPPSPDCPYWQGEEGINLVVRGEQGIGDELHFASILPEVIEKQKSVTLDCFAKLEGLFRRSFPSIEIHPTRQDKPADKDWRIGRTFDAHCLIGSLSHHRRKTRESFPGTPFLVADPERRLQWRALLDTLPGLKVGLAWTGGKKDTGREFRSMPLEKLLPILQTKGVSFVSLQYQDPLDEIRELHEAHGITVHHWKRAAEASDYDETAALVAELDLVITVCTAVVHLSGGLGKECWVLVPRKPRWFYGIDGQRSPWYRSVEMFRQADEWPIREVAARLAERP